MQKNLGYLKCPLHKSQYIQLVCLSCEENSLACPLCLDSQHNMHMVISLKKYMNDEIPKLYAEKPNVDNLSEKIDNLTLIFKQSIEKLRKQIGHEINQLQLYFIEKQDRIKQELLFVCGSFDVKEIYENINASKIMIKQGRSIPRENQICSKLQQIQNKSNQILSDACLEIRRVIYKLKRTHNDSLDILLNSKSLSSFQFAKSLSHPSIQIRNRSQAINKNFDNKYHCSVVTPPLNPFKNSITFDVKKSDHKCVWLGVTDLEVVLKQKFENAYKGEGANYWIWQAGGDDQAQIYAQNSGDKPLVGWNFLKGDMITLKIEYGEKNEKKLVILKNNDEESKYMMQIDKRIGSYYPCISLGDEEEAISIIED